eukprot:168284-Amphidinium_carterae.1
MSEDDTIVVHVQHHMTKALAFRRYINASNYNGYAVRIAPGHTILDLRLMFKRRFHLRLVKEFRTAVAQKIGTSISAPFLHHARGAELVTVTLSG